MRHHQCKTYLYIQGKFNPEDIIKIIEVKPSRYHSDTDIRKDGKPYGFSRIVYGFNEQYDVDMNAMAIKTIEQFLDKIDLLKQIQEQFQCKIYLQAVVKVANDIDEPFPILPTGKNVIDFCHNANISLDIDYYVI